MKDTKYGILRLQLEEDIINHYRADDQFMSQREIMEKYQVSYSTVERALRELTELGILTRIHGKGSFVCAKKNFDCGTRKLALVKSDNVAVGPDMFYAKVLMQICETLGDENFSTVLIHVDINHGIEAVLTRLLNGDFCGALLVGVIPDELIERLYARNFPIVLVDRGTENLRVPYVATANYDGAELAVEQLFAAGAKRIGFVSTPLHTSFLERYEAYCNALVNHGCPLVRKNCILNLNFDFAEESIARLMSSDDAPDALFFANDSIAVRCMKILENLKIRVPEDVKIMGFDGDPVGEHCTPALSTMFVDTAHMGKVAGEMMLARLAGEKVESVNLPTSFLKRQSF